MEYRGQMPKLHTNAFGRRAVLLSMLVAGSLALPGCTTMGMPRTGAGGQADAVDRLLMLASQRAFAKLTQPDGFWDSTVARINLPVLFARPGSGAEKLLKSNLFRESLQHKLNNFAEGGARAAAPLVYQSVRALKVTDGSAVLRGGNTAATTLLRTTMASSLVNAMIPELTRLMQEEKDPVVSSAVAALKGVTITDAAHALALDADNAIWYEIGAEEAAIRKDPASTNDPALTAALQAVPAS
ncbi:hypothetical protein ASE49_13990 [Novosphingobium sp. Leaf2]|nr:hypothetical protein ASE49_13990 [Novosphingobium sp. Leaf2]